MGNSDIIHQKPHLLILPVEEQGHFTVYVNLLYHFSQFDIRVTLCSSSARCQELANLRSAGAFSNLDLHLKDIFSAAGVSSAPKAEGHVPPVWNITKEMSSAFKTYMPQLLQAEDPNSRPTVLLADMFLGWSKEVAEELDIPRYVMFTTSAWAPLSFLWRQVGNWTPDDIMTIPGLSPIRIKDGIPVILEPLINVDNARGIICNSYEELEQETVVAVRTHLQEHPNSNGQVTQFLPIGPTIYLPGNPIFPDKKHGDHCLNWLNSQAQSSVLYVAFGTVGKMAEETLLEIAYSLENCNVPFLWALRLPLGVKEASSVLPPGFLDRTKARGHVEFGFVPQLQILNHPSIGGFLSHCGWNSTIESICAGVPVISHPLHGDQPLNARLLEEVTRTGMGIQRSPEGRFTRDGICTGILALMVGEKGKEIRANTAKWKEAALASQKDGGSSSLRDHDFVQGIMQSACK
ncbi:hypothetical protein R1sor_022797 [Riccia sorocarpa]|uniref:Glycosyltransferase n=1 Tax=Riccia sorocarpa TaxID=122646 RepID=A0ABD3GPT8_9MARC